MKTAILVFLFSVVALPVWATIEPSPQGQVRSAGPASQPATANQGPNAIVGDDANDDDDSDDENDDGHVDDGESEADSAGNASDVSIVNRYTLDIDEPTLEKSFVSAVESLGTISVGFTDSGRLINGEKLECDDSCEVVVPAYGFGTHEMVEAISKAARAVKLAYPASAPLRVNHIGKKEGGYLRPHRSHQSGRDADLGFYYKNDSSPGSVRGQRTKWMDLARNWILLRTLVIEADVQVILVDKAVQKVLYDYALEQGEDQQWLDAVFKGGNGKKALVQHARRHRDHFHARLFAPRSQELGRRVQPILNKRPEENVISYRIKGGDNLGKIAKKHGCTVAMIQKANGMKNTFLRVGHTLRVPLRGPCTHCPLPPPIVVPPRCLPPVASASAPAAPPL